MTDAEKTAGILAAMRNAAGVNVIWAEELHLSSGARRCDFWTLHPHASQGYLARAYEIKVSRADFKRDNAMKQRQARLFSDEFYYATPRGLIRPEELPDWAGLEEYDQEEDGTWRRAKVISAPRRDKDAPSWELVVSIMRYSGQTRRDTDLLKKEIGYWKWRAERAEGRRDPRSLPPELPADIARPA